MVTNNAVTSNLSSSLASSKQFSCLYTKQKVQKRKTWHDGRLVLRSCSAQLFNARPTIGHDAMLDEYELSRSQLQTFLDGSENELETESYLVQVEGPWTNGVENANKPARVVSANMRRIVKRKYRRPGPYVPNINRKQNKTPPSLLNRRPPLQPGELERRMRQTTTPPSSCFRNHDDDDPHDAHRFGRNSDPTYRESLVPGDQPDDGPFQNFGGATPNHATNRPPKANNNFHHTSQSSFTANGFNQRKFYEEEEEEEEEDDGKFGNEGNTLDAITTSQVGATVGAFVDKPQTISLLNNKYGDYFDDQQTAAVVPQPQPTAGYANLFSQRNSTQSQEDTLPEIAGPRTSEDILDLFGFGQPTPQADAPQAYTDCGDQFQLPPPLDSSSNGEEEEGG